MTEQELTRGFDPLDFEAIVTAYSDMVFQLAWSRLKTREDAEDVSQEVMYRYARNARTIRSEEHCRAWLVRVTLNLCNSFYRSADVRHHASLTDAVTAVAEDEAAGRVIDERLDYLDVRSAMALLPSQYRDILHLYYYEQWPVQTIASVLDMRPGTVKSQLHRGRQRLARLLGGDLNG